MQVVGLKQLPNNELHDMAQVRVLGESAQAAPIAQMKPSEDGESVIVSSQSVIRYVQRLFRTLIEDR